MPSLSFTAPTTVDEAINALAGAPGLAKPLSGGTDLLVQLRSGRMRPELIVDTQENPGSDRHPRGRRQFCDRRRHPGRHAQRARSLHRAWPGIVEGVDLIGSQQIQGRASLVGNLCNASPAADSVPAMIAARAVAVIAGPDGTARGAGRGNRHRPGPDLAKRASSSSSSACRSPSRGNRDAYLRFIPRTEMDIAVVGCGVNVTLDAGGICTDARVVLGAVAPTQLIVDEAAEALKGHRLDDDTLSRLDAAAQRACKPINDKRGTIEYRTKVAGVLARRAAAIAFERADGRVAGVH